MHAGLVDLAELDRVSFRRTYEGHVYLDCKEELAELDRAVVAAKGRR